MERTVSMPRGRSGRSQIAIDPELENKLFDLIAAGNYPSTACAAVGINQLTYNQWIKRGEGRDRTHATTPEYVAFALRMRQAEAMSEVDAVKEVKKGIEKDPAIGLKYLGRRFRDRWGETITHKNDWTINAITMLKIGDVTWKDLEGTFDVNALEEIKTRLLESGEQAYWEEMAPEEKVDSDTHAEQSA